MLLDLLGTILAIIGGLLIGKAIEKGKIKSSMILMYRGLGIALFGLALVICVFF